MLIGLKGYKGVGKDTVADYLVAEYGFTKVAFADKMKEAVAGLFGISREQVDQFKNNDGNSLDLVEVHIDIASRVEYVYTWREFLQRFGTEMGRNIFGEDFWVDQLALELPLYKQHVTALSQYVYTWDWRVDGDIVIPDARFENEARRIRELGGHMVEIRRPGYEPDGHASEEPLPEDLINHRIVNGSSVDILYSLVDEVINELR